MTCGKLIWGDFQKVEKGTHEKSPFPTLSPNPIVRSFHGGKCYSSEFPEMDNAYVDKQKYVVVFKL